MSDETKELLAEIRRMRAELQEVRDIVNTLFSMVIEVDLDEEFEILHDPRSNPSMYN
ncbi:MAG: hypothetical protein KAU99_04290 [Thermoplasmata archaeon]|nr:hypothetical protein [Thermoplasmata archaeon]